jgi:hypothetical protein
MMCGAGNSSKARFDFWQGRGCGQEAATVEVTTMISDARRLSFLYVRMEVAELEAATWVWMRRIKG